MDDFPEFTDPVDRLLLTGQASSLREAEEMYLDASMPELLKLCGSSMSNEELEQHPLFRLLLAHGSRGWEDSVA
jgi:hypothetical protein